MSLAHSHIRAVALETHIGPATEKKSLKYIREHGMGCRAYNIAAESERGAALGVRICGSAHFQR